MTRATVGGINSEDNLWYPLAVNSQGIAQIDTSVIPDPYQPTSGSFTPYYTSETGGDDFALIDYSFSRRGNWYRIYNLIYFEFYIATNNAVITDPRGTLQLILDVPGIYGGSPQLLSLSIDRSVNFASNVPCNSLSAVWYPGSRGWNLQKPSVNVPDGIDDMLVTELREGQSGGGNNLIGFGFFMATATRMSGVWDPAAIGWNPTGTP